jgi:hypothetical protein
MQTIEGFDFQALTFDRDGKPSDATQIATLAAHVNTVSASDVVFLAHGFRNSEADALNLYTNFLKTFRANSGRTEFAASVLPRRIVVGGILWPSRAFREADDIAASGEEGKVQGLGDDAAERARVRAALEELRDDARPEHRPKLDRALNLLSRLENNPEVQDEFVDLVLSVLDKSNLDASEGLDRIQAQAGSDLLAKLVVPIAVPTAGGDDQGGVASAENAQTRGFGNVVGSITGRVGQLLNLTTWYVMKDRSGTVGAVGASKAVRDVKASRPGVKIHLVGHSLGARLMAAAAKALCTNPRVEPDSLTLLEAAFSHYGFSPDNGFGSPGYFRDVVAQKIVKGPFVSTFSAEDTVVGKAYSVASRLAGDNTRAVGEANDPYGGLGRNGTQRTVEAVSDVLHQPGTLYDFKAGVISNLDGSGGLIKDHSDVTNPAVTYAFASALART